MSKLNIPAVSNPVAVGMRQNMSPEPIGYWWICNDDPSCEGKALVDEAGMAFCLPLSFVPRPVTIFGTRAQAEREACRLLGLDREEWEEGGYYLARPWRVYA